MTEWKIAQDPYTKRDVEFQIDFDAKTLTIKIMFKSGEESINMPHIVASRMGCHDPATFVTKALGIRQLEKEMKACTEVIDPCTGKKEEFELRLDTNALVLFVTFKSEIKPMTIALVTYPTSSSILWTIQAILRGRCMSGERTIDQDPATKEVAT